MKINIIVWYSCTFRLKCLKWKRKRILNVGWNVEKPKHPSAVVGV